MKVGGHGGIKNDGLNGNSDGDGLYSSDDLAEEVETSSHHSSGNISLGHAWYECRTKLSGVTGNTDPAKLANTLMKDIAKNYGASFTTDGGNMADFSNKLYASVQLLAQDIVECVKYGIDPGERSICFENVNQPGMSGTYKAEYKFGLN